MSHAARAQKIVVVVHGPVADVVPDDRLWAYAILRPHPDEPSPHPDAVGAVVLAWLGTDAAVYPDRWFDVPVDAYRVDERVHLDWTRDWADGTASPGVAQCSFVRRRAGLSREEFAAHWNDVHAPLVPVHHPGVARYVQNVVVEPLTSGAPEVDGIAQLSFRTVHDFHERYYDSDDGREIVRADVARFIDRPAGWRIHARETWMRSRTTP